jgi:Holliday junction resolvase-like predicted endonuclease
MDITKSSRHQKIIGNFGENLVCNWLSRSGFEVALVDQVGMDIIASHPSLPGKPLGITVNARTRTKGTEGTQVTVFRGNDREKLLQVCETFRCEPWIAVYVEATECADAYLTSLDNYDRSYRRRERRVVDDWKMRDKDRRQYDADPNV